MQQNLTFYFTFHVFFVSHPIHSKKLNLFPPGFEEQRVGILLEKQNRYLGRLWWILLVKEHWVWSRPQVAEYAKHHLFLPSFCVFYYLSSFSSRYGNSYPVV